MKKLLCIVLCIGFVFLCSCGFEKKVENDTQAADIWTTMGSHDEESIERYISLGYLSMESLDPYKTESKTNRFLSSLIYDPLFKLSGNYEALPVVAVSYDQNGSDLNVELRTDVFFSNGAPLTAEDVIYSFETAKESSFYSSRLSNFGAAYPSRNGVTFSVSKPDVYAVNCLDFPIIQKNGSENDLPLGSGRYVLEKENSNPVLKKNENYIQNEEIENEIIKLVDINETRDEYALLQIGEMSFAFDDFSDDAHEHKIDANTAAVGLNNLVYLGFNSDSERIKDEYVKAAVIDLIDREALCRSAYSSDAKPCATAFNPLWSEVQKLEAQVPAADAVAAKESLEKGGYIYAYSNNEIRSKNFEFLELRFIVCENDSRKVKLANEIKSALLKVGVGVRLSVISYDEYKARLRDGMYDIYLGEIKLTNNMSLSPFFSENASASFGIDGNSTVKNAYYDFQSGKIDISTFTEVFDECMPFIPICYRTGTAYYSKELQFDGSVSESDIFSNIYTWMFSEPVRS